LGDNPPTIVDKLDFAEWLQNQLYVRNMTQAQLAREARVSRGAIGKLLKHQSTRPDPETLQKIARAFQMAPETLFRMVGWLPERTDVPELDELVLVASKMPPPARVAFLNIGKNILECIEKLER
jgi:transcriptional regulator with XRE-family HTH domain